MSVTDPVPGLAERARASARRLAGAESVLLASHVDADGLTSAAIAARALERAGIAHEVTFEDQLDDAVVERLAADAADVLLLTDFGSGQLDAVYEHCGGALDDGTGVTPVIADHHQPIGADAVPDAAPTVSREHGPDYADAPYHVNPLLVGIDGARECSGAGATYCLARALAAEVGTAASDPGDGSRDNRDLAALAVVGAVGDMQTVDGELVGANAAIVAEGEAVDVLDAATDLAVYGTQTRSLPALFAYADELSVPGVSNDRAGAERFLRDLDVETHDEGEWRRWADLTAAERRTVASALVQRAVQRGVPARRIDEFVGTSYTLVREVSGTELRDASEFSTLLNATARYDRAEVGLAVCLGDRDDALDAARELLREHRRNLSAGVEWVEAEGVTREEHCQWFHAGDEIRPTILGIVAGMALGADGVDPSTPIVAFAADDDAIKVSARATPRLVEDGVDLSAAMARAAGAVDGSGGGHTVAAGATIPAGSETAFVAAVDGRLGEQRSGS